MSKDAPAGALDGLRVIDLTQMLAGPFCTMMLADQGAEVIKVEPLEGDGTRQMGPFAPDDELRAFGGYFQSVNRNKLSIALDLKRPEARELLLKLVDGAQVVVENYRAGVMDRLGLAYETLRARNRRLVYASIRGFGDPRTGKSPYVDWPAYDVVAQAMGGIMAITGPDAATPTKVGPGVGDVVPAIMAAYGIIAAVTAFTERHTRRELMEILGGQVPFGPVFDVSDIAADPHFRARDMVVPLDHPGTSGKRAVAGVPIRLSETPGGVRRRAPLLGEDTDKVLTALGLSPAAIARLRADKAVR